MQVRRLAAILVLLLSCASGQSTSAQQNLTLLLFERYLEAFREEAGIPSISAAILHNGIPIWRGAFGRRDIDSNDRARPDTPYLIGDASQAIGATLLLRMCVEQGALSLADPLVDWAPGFPEPASTVGSVLSHIDSAGVYRFAPMRFAWLTPAIEACSDTPYRDLLVREVFERYGMRDSVPGTAVLDPGLAPDVPPELRAHYASVLQRLATPYRVDRGRPFRSDVPLQSVNAANGIVSTVDDLARFDAALGAGTLLNPDTLQLAWTPKAAGATGAPTGLGWFVQPYTSASGVEPLVWHFGMVKDAYSSLILKVPNRGLTLIMLANSDGLAGPFALEKGDVTASLFARLFLRLFVI